MSEDNGTLPAVVVIDALVALSCSALKLEIAGNQKPHSWEQGIGLKQVGSDVVTAGIDNESELGKTRNI